MYMVKGAIQKYFWDVNPADLDIVTHKRYIIERILDLGDDEAVAWLHQTFSQKDIEEVLATSRRISLKSRHFWELIAEKV